MPINIPTIQDTNTSLYIKNLSNEYGKSYRELKSLWEKFYNEVNYDVMLNPTKYSNFGKLEIYDEVGKRLDEYLVNPTKESEEAIQNEEVDNLEQGFENEIETNLEQPTEPTSIEGEPEIAPTEEGGEPTEEGTDDPVSADENAQMPSDEELDAVFAEFGLCTTLELKTQGLRPSQPCLSHCCYTTRHLTTAPVFFV